MKKNQEHKLDMDAIQSEYLTSKTYRDRFILDFKQLGNLVDGVPVQKDGEAPFVGDTTLAGLVRSIPRKSLKQLPVFSSTINGTKRSFHAYVSNFLLRAKVFNENTFGKGLLSTLQIGTEGALTYGYTPFLVATGLMYDDFGTTMRLIHYSDATLEPGVFDANEATYFFVEAHLTKSRVERIIKAAAANPKSPWDVEALKAVLESTPTDKNYSQYQTDPRNQGSQFDGSTYTFVTRYETGKGARTITFCAESPEKPLRVIESRSKWGYPRLQFLVIDPATLTPFGISRVRLASPNQNLMNIYYGNIAAGLLLNSKPPLYKKGVFLRPTHLKQGAVWETVDPTAEIRIMPMDNGSLNQFTAMAQQFAGQIQNIMGGQTMTVNAGSKESQFGRTAPGVRAGQEFADIETQQITKILENFLRQYALCALDTIISEQTGKETLVLDDQAKNEINFLKEQEYAKNPEIDQVTGLPLPYVPVIGDNNEVEIDWTQFYDFIRQMSVEVEVSLSPDELKDQKHADLQDMLVVLAQNAESIPGASEQVAKISKLLLQDKASEIMGHDVGQMPQPDMGQPSLPPQIQ